MTIIESIGLMYLVFTSTFGTLVLVRLAYLGYKAMLGEVTVESLAKAGGWKSRPQSINE